MVTAVGAIFCGISDNLWILAVPMIVIAILANITAFWRIAHCYNVMTKKEN